MVRRREESALEGTISISPTIIRGSAIMLVCVRIKRYLVPGSASIDVVARNNREPFVPGGSD